MALSDCPNCWDTPCTCPGSDYAVTREAKKLIEDWVSKQGHDRCWYYPDIFNKLATLFGVKVPERGLPSLEEFKEGCKKYQAAEFGGTDGTR